MPLIFEEKKGTTDASKPNIRLVNKSELEHMLITQPVGPF